MSMKISFIILTWNRSDFLEKCLSSLIESLANPSQCEILILDNGSTDQTREVLERYRSNESFRVFFESNNLGISAYKKMFKACKGEYIVTVDDDVIQFPQNIDKIFIEYMSVFAEYGYLSLNVIQNKMTDGAKPTNEHYSEDVRDGNVVLNGPAGGWCACFRKNDFSKIRILFNSFPLSMRFGEDGMLSFFLKHILRLKTGVIKNKMCLHACGPLYAKMYGHLDREIEKYKLSGLKKHAQIYESEKRKE